MYKRQLQGESYTRDPMFWHSSLGRPASTGDTRSSAVISGDWKLIQWYSLEDATIVRTELYNLAEDPGEHQDLAVLETAKRAELEALLNDWKESVNARLGAFKGGGG